MIKKSLLISALIFSTLSHANVFDRILAFLGKSEDQRIADYCNELRWDLVKSSIEKLKNSESLSEQTLATCINLSACHGRWKLLKTFLDEDSERATYVSPRCIKRAIKRGYKRTLSVAVEKGCDLLNLSGDQTVLHVAARASKSSAEITAIFLKGNDEHFEMSGERFFDIDRRSLFTGRTALGEALYHEKYETARVLLDGGASLFEAVHADAEKNRPEEVLLAKGNEQERGLVKRWFKIHTMRHLEKYLRSSKVAPLHKYAVFQYFSKNTKGRREEKIRDIWRKHEYESLLPFVKNDSESLDSFWQESDPEEHVNVCLDLCNEGGKTYCDLAPCHHKICEACVKASIQVMATNATLTCPAKGCEALIPFDRLLDFEVSKKQVLELKIKSLEKEIGTNRKFHHCQQPNCPGGAFKIRKFAGSATHFHCVVCGHFQCIECGKTHPKLDCAEKEYRKNELFIARQKAKKLIKPCPNCNADIEKHNGCDHMSCRCGHEFYWSSLGSYSDFDYSSEDSDSSSSSSDDSDY